MADLILGPVLRYVDDTRAVVWVETDASCEVDVLGATAPTFHVAGHHYGVVRVVDLEPGTSYEYEVALDGERVWPLEDSEFPPSRITTYSPDIEPRIYFGSCRVAVPHHPPHSLPKDQDERGREVDALRTVARRMIDQDPSTWPDLLLWVGDQIYADEVSPRTLDFIQHRRDVSKPPGEIALDFEEYTELYKESWNEPVTRWMLSTVSSAMIFDDHDVHDDWNTSAAWLEEVRESDWWAEHIQAALMTYWIYQHVGNLSPEEQDDEGLLDRLQHLHDGTGPLREYAHGADRQKLYNRWSYHRDIGRSRLLVIDSRCGRVLEEGQRSMLDEEEWQWVERHATGGFDHLMLATSLPWLLAPGMHYLEAWNEAVCGGAWGGPAAKLGEKLRQGLDLEHWAAFQESFERLAEIQRSVGAGERGEPPKTIVTMSGDVHHAYLDEVAFHRDAGVRSAVYQAVCSPMRNPLDARERRAIKTMFAKPVAAIMHGLARAAGVSEPSVRWRAVDGGPWFDNQLATLEISGPRMDFRIERARRGEDGEAILECVQETRLS
jgi:hypothetical protein